MSTDRQKSVSGFTKRSLKKIVWTMLQSSSRIVGEPSTDPRLAEFHPKRVAIRAGDWLIASQRVTRSSTPSGYSRHFDLISRSWAAPYPETTGYIIPSLLWLAEFTNCARFHSSAINAADWLGSIQYSDGGIPDPTFSRPLVFDAAQAVLGLNTIFRDSGNSDYLEAAIKAGNWVVDHQDDDGAWRSHTFNHEARAYYLKASACLLNLGQSAGDLKFERAAKRNLAWVLSNIRSNGWFDGASFSGQSQIAYAHLACYILEGLIDFTEFAQSEQAHAAAGELTRTLSGLIDPNSGLIFGEFDKDSGRPSDTWLCTIASAQLYSCLFRMHRLGYLCHRLPELVANHNKLLNRQLLSGVDQIRGNCLPADPPYAGYVGIRLVNWLPKYLIDSIRELSALDDKYTASKAAP